MSYLRYKKKRFTHKVYADKNVTTSVASIFLIYCRHGFQRKRSRLPPEEDPSDPRSKPPNRTRVYGNVLLWSPGPTRVTGVRVRKLWLRFRRHEKLPSDKSSVVRVVDVRLSLFKKRGRDRSPGVNEGQTSLGGQV